MFGNKYAHEGVPRAPKHLTNIEPEFAGKVASQYNAESTYHEGLHEEAKYHLDTADVHLAKLVATLPSGSKAHQSATEAQVELANARRAHSTYNMETAQEHAMTAYNHLNNAYKFSTLSNLSDHMQKNVDAHIGTTARALGGYYNTYNPSRVTTNRDKRGTRTSVTVDPNYRSRANVDVERDKDKVYVDADGKRLYGGFKTPDALYKKVTYPAEQSRPNQTQRKKQNSEHAKKIRKVREQVEQDRPRGDGWTV